MRRFFPILGLSLLAACATAGRSSGDPNTVTGDQLRATGATNVEAAIRELRPQWLESGRESASVDRNNAIQVCRGTLRIYVNGEPARRGMNQVALSRVAEVRYIRPGAMRPDGDRRCRSQAAIDIRTTQ
jgi:hypothetical protein